MWRRIVNGARSFIKNSPSPASTNLQSPSLAKPPLNISAAEEAAKVAAYNQLKEAMKDLSGGDSRPIILPSDSEISKWLKKPVDQLPVDQLEELARVYYEGSKDISADPAKAVELWSLAASKGSVEARYSRAICLKDGVGIAEDKATAFQELQALAEKHNYNFAHYSLAIMHDRGEGCAIDLEKAFYHYRLAAKGGIQPAFHNLANAYAFGRGVEKNDENARMLYEAGVEMGDPASLYVLATWHYKGRGGLEVNKQKAFELQLQAAQAKHPAAMFNVGAALLVGDGVGEDAPKAAEWFEKAARLGIAEASLNLAKMYMEGKGVPRDLEVAREIVGRIADKNVVARELLLEIDTIIQQEQSKVANT
eukprot:gene28592-34516_t